MSAPARAAVAIVTYNSAADIGACLAALRAEQETLPHHVVVLDNASQDDSAAVAAAADPRATVIRAGENLGFGRGNNRALEGRREPFVVLVNPDCRVRPGTLSAVVEYLERHPDVGVLGVRTVDEDGSVQSCEMEFPGPWRELVHVVGSSARLTAALGDLAWRLTGRGPARPVEWMLGAFLALPRAAWDRLGGFDPGIFMYGEDMDLCWRAREAGWRVAYHPGIEVVHPGNRSGGPAFGSGRERRVLEAMLSIYGKHAGPGGEDALLRAMRARLRAKVWWLRATGLLRGREATERKVADRLARLAILDEIARDPGPDEERP